MSLFFTINQSQCAIIERFGKFSRIVYAGLHMRLPLIESFKKVAGWGDVANRENGWLIELAEQLTVADARECQTKDNVTVASKASVYWRINDPKRAVYEVDRLPAAVLDVALNALRANVGTMDLDAVLSERQTLNEKIAAQLTETAQKWGIQFTRVEIREIITTDETAAAMRQQMVAERRRRAAVADAEGQAIAEIKAAEAAKTAAILRAEGLAAALALTSEAEAKYLALLRQQATPDAASQILIAQKFLDGLDKMSKNPAHQVYLPNSFTGLFSMPIGDGGGSQAKTK